MPVEQQLTTADLANTANGRDMETGEKVTHNEPLLPRDFSDDMRTRWEAIQTGFVDDPRVSVQRADELVASAIKKLAESFADERGRLEQQWSRGNDVSTEDLRQALRRYREFFNRLLTV
ncbi:MAG TPA: hypothetical protein VG456_13805 [Candidatus Sulfopaludibacter sp.]|jgi:hypothetical protein|nr:hypothetical protein [Candidatus Sulfopaludibacter sp.]